MNKSELINAIDEQIDSARGITKKDIATVLDALGAVAAEEMKLESGEIPLPGIGKLKATVKAGRTARNPRTGETLVVPAKNAVKLVLAKEMRDAIN